MGYSHVIGFDDGPFEKGATDPVMVVGAICAGTRLHGVVSFEITPDGDDSAESIITSVRTSKFREHLQLVMLQGIAFGGFNVVDVHRVSDELGLPVMVVSRKEPDMERIRSVLLDRVPSGEEKWRLIESLGPMEPVAGVWTQRVRLDRQTASDVIASSVVEGHLPEPLRIAHLVAGGVVRGESRSRP